MRPFIVLLVSLLLPLPQAAPQPADVEGDWIGTLVTPGMSLRLAYHVTHDDAGQLVGTMDSLDQGAMGLKIAAVTVNRDAVRFVFNVPAAAFDGVLSSDRTRIQGTWTQGSASLPLLLTRAEPPKRPQEPKRPYPYIDEDVRYQNKTAGITLAGTLTLPRVATPAPAVILITGSGPEDRDETLFGHKPFLVLADHLTRQGIAVLRVDDRGVGGSSGNTMAATSEDFATDVLAGVDYLKTRREIDPKRIGLVGHSEGGMIAPIAASRSRDIGFIVLMAGPGLPGDEIVYLQSAAIAKAGGANESAIAANEALQHRIITVVKTETDPQAAETKLNQIVDEMVAAVPDAQKQEVASTLRAQIRSLSTPWFRFFFSYDPRPTLSKVSCPVLAVTGELDLQVPFTENLAAIDAALKGGGNTRSTVVHLPRLNHLFQTATTGSPGEYYSIEETIAPAALDTITGWIQKTVKGP
jgi:pimeloyl-ACP methyl ester carboxylesterase